MYRYIACSASPIMPMFNNSYENYSCDMGNKPKKKGLLDIKIPDSSKKKESKLSNIKSRYDNLIDIRISKRRKNEGFN